jgi:hypothetical protein
VDSTSIVVATSPPRLNSISETAVCHSVQLHEYAEADQEYERDEAQTIGVGRDDPWGGG